MYNVNKTNIYSNINKVCYIASKLPNTQDDNYNDLLNYDIPIKYVFNVMPINSDSEIKAFGEVSLSMKVAVISKNINKYFKINKDNERVCIFKSFDLAYLDGVIPTNEINNGDKANYVISAVQVQNSIIKIYFKKIIK